METAPSNWLDYFQSYMHNTIRTLFVISNRSEAQQALKIADLKLDKLLALSLEAEYFICSKLKVYDNPLYRFLKIDGPTCSYYYLLPGFEEAYKFAEKENLAGIRDRLGYFLSEFNRSYEFADKLIEKLNPRTIILSKLKYYPGSSIINGSLKPHAIYLVSKEKRIPCKFFKEDTKRKTLRQILGGISNKIYLLKKDVPCGNFDLVIIAPPRHIFQLKGMIKDLKRAGLKLLIMSYTLTPRYRNILNKYIGDYIEKEKILVKEINSKSRMLVKSVLKSKPWIHFQFSKYRNNSLVTMFLRRKIKDIVEHELLENMTDKVRAETFFNQVSSKVLLTTTDPDSKVMHFIKYAKNNGVKTLAMQHGVMWSPAPPSVLPISDKFIVWSNISKRWIKKIKGTEKMTFIIGQSPFHKVPGYLSCKSKKNIRILFLATIVILDINVIAYYQKKLFETLNQLNDIHITVRIHPFQETINLKALINNYRSQMKFDTNDNLRDSINKSDLVIFEETTAGFDSMISEKPTIFFNPYSGEDYFNIRKNNVGMCILSYQDIEEKLPGYIKDRKKWKYYANKGKKFAEQYLGINNQNKLMRAIVSQVSQ